jgi:hypothetical protein
MTTLHSSALQTALLRKPKPPGMSATELWFWSFAYATAAVIAWMMAR